MKFREIIPTAARDYVNRLNPDNKIDTFNMVSAAWVNINRRGGFNAVHHHGEMDLSGVYYVKQPSKARGHSGMIEFINSRFDEKIFKSVGGLSFSPKHSMRVPTGTMIVFPASLNHFVYPNETNDERITVAWNLKFIKL